MASNNSKLIATMMRFTYLLILPKTACSAFPLFVVASATCNSRKTMISPLLTASSPPSSCCNEDIGAEPIFSAWKILRRNKKLRQKYSQKDAILYDGLRIDVDSDVNRPRTERRRIFSRRKHRSDKSSVEISIKHQDDIDQNDDISTTHKKLSKSKRKNKKRELPPFREPNPAEIETAKKLISLPLWAIQCEEEIYRLATMKAMLKEPLEKLQTKTINLPKSTTSQFSKSTSVPIVKAFPDVYGDLRLLRFLRKDSVQDPNRAAVRFHEFLDWRNEFRVDELRAHAQISIDDEPPMDEMKKVAEYMPCDFQAGPADYEDGTLPIFLGVGQWNTVEITNQIRNGNLGLETFLRYWAFMFDSLHKRLYEESLNAHRLLYVDEIIDTAGFSLTQVSPAFVSTVLKPWISLTQANYPETARRIIVLNPPSIIRLAWRIITPLANPSTVEKIKLVSNFPGTARDYLAKQIWKK